MQCSTRSLQGLTSLSALQYAPGSSVLQFSSVNLITQSKPCFHIARFLPSIKDCQAPFTFAWQVSMMTELALAAAQLLIACIRALCCEAACL